ncbi:MAG: hypothetical protein JSV39_04910 [Candidatus Aenigmatarchaeota archaeon]|nr:MAG: hypothetical protein JSV39_04910 [Candidatus Aenigmarchaeota archaeon]
MNIPNTVRLTKGKLYIILSFILWLIAEYVTVWHARLGEWISLMPYVFIQYLVIILIFYYFIFRKKLSEKGVFIVMLVVMYFFEILWQNPLLLNVFLFIPSSLLLISIWGFVTFIPLWVVKKSLQKHKIQAVYYSLWIVVALITYLLT